MKHWKMICGVCVVVLVAALVALLLTGGQREGQAGGEAPVGLEMEDRPVGEMSRQDAAAARLLEFARVIYTYDTAERMFYEGAERFMTEEAYREFLPLMDQDAYDGVPIRMESTLLEAVPYFWFTEDGAKALLESRFSISSQGRGYIVQYLELTMEEAADGEWMITACRVIDTIEQ